MVAVCDDSQIECYFDNCSHGVCKMGRDHLLKVWNVFYEIFHRIHVNALYVESNSKVLPILQ